MTTLPPIPTTREFLMATAYRQTGRIACLIAGTTLLSIPAARAVDWNGSASTDWNTAANWTPAGVPAGANAIIKVSTPNFAKISANLTATPVDILLGLDAGSNARLDHVAGNAGTGTGNWMFVGRNGGTGVYNLGDTAGTGGTHTGMATGTGSMTVGGRLYIGGNAGTGSTGTVNVNTTGSLAMGAHLEIGTNTSAGTLNLDAGTVSAGDWIEVGNGTGCSGTLRMSGGTINKTGVNGFIVGANGSTGLATISGGAINSTVVGGNGQFRVSNNTGSNATLNLSGTGAINVTHEIWVGNNTGATGAMNITGGTVTNNSWVAIGRKDGANVGVGGVGTVTMSAGTWTKTGDSNFIVGASGNGTMNMTGGLVSVAASAVADRGITWVGETNNCTGVLSLSLTAEFRSPRITMGNVAGATGTLNLDGGTVKAGQITGGNGNANIHFNGTEIIPTANQADFVTNLDVADIKAGHLKVNTNGFNVTIPQVLTAGSAGGGVVKTGAGTLTLSGANSYTGDHTITAGKLVVTDSATGGGSFTVANSATFGVTQTVENDSLDTANVTFGSARASALDINLGSIPGNPSAAPLNVTGALTLNGTVTINVADALPAVGTVPLINYVSPKGGSGTFVLGSLPNGVVAHLVDNGSGQVSLEIDSVSLPLWDGTVDGKWDTTTQNWIDRATGFPTTYANPAPVRFDDDASGITAITLNQTVSPSKVTFDNSSDVYGITGGGKITGTTGLTKAGSAAVSIGTPNDFTGAVSISGGTLTAATLANGGSASAIGASTAAPANLMLEGGTLGYTGPSTTIDRGFTINGTGSGISTTNDLSLTGAVSNVTGTFIKKGAGNLTFPQNSAVGLGTINPSLQLQEGTLTFSGAGSQVINVAGEFQAGNVPDLPANVVLNNTSLVATGFIALSRGQGDNGVTNFTATNSTIQSVSFSTGYNNALPNNASEAFIVLNNTTWTNNGVAYLAESTGSAGTMTLNGTSVFNAVGTTLLGRNAGTTAVLTLKDTSSINKTAGYTGVGAGGNGTLNVQDSASFTSNVDDFNVGDGANATGTLNLSGNGAVSAAQVYVGKGAGANGTLNQTGGTFQSSSFVTIGRFAGGVGTVNVPAGTFSQNGTGSIFYVAQEGTATLNVSGTGTVVSNGTQLLIGGAATANGTVNLNGGTLTVKQVTEGAGGNSEFHFNGGLLKANTGANANFLTGLDVAYVKAGGAFIDPNGQTITIAQNLVDGTGGGGLTKSGAGTVLLNGSNSYTGATTVAAGTLGGTGSVAGTLAVPAGSTIAPGTAVGTFTSGAATIGGTYACDIDGANADKLAVNGALVISPGAILDFGTVNAPTAPALVIASYTSLTGTFTVQDLPAGYQVVYNYNNGINSNNIALVTGASNPYQDWAAVYFPGVTDVNIVGPAADPDKDGSPNSLEFALGGVPNIGADRPKVFQLTADGSDADTDKELLVTIAVRGTPAFGSGPAPTATADGFRYTVRGSLTLAGFTSPVSVVTTPVAPAAPNATPPAGYVWRTFSLDGSNNLPGKGFLRVAVEEAP